MAAALQAAGARVAVTGRDEAKNARAQETLGPHALALGCDVTDEESVLASVARVVVGAGGLHILVNHAGAFRDGPVTELSLEAWRAVRDSHVTRAFLCATHAAGP